MQDAALSAALCDAFFEIEGRQKQTKKHRLSQSGPMRERETHGQNLSALAGVNVQPWICKALPPLSIFPPHSLPLIMPPRSTEPQINILRVCVCHRGRESAEEAPPPPPFLPPSAECAKENPLRRGLLLRVQNAALHCDPSAGADITGRREGRSGGAPLPPSRTHGDVSLQETQTPPTRSAGDRTAPVCRLSGLLPSLSLFTHGLLTD